MGVVLHWTGEKGLKDIGGQCDECGEEETKKGILTKILWSNKSIDKIFLLSE